MNFPDTGKATSRFDQAASQWDSNPTRVELARAVGATIERTISVQPHWRALDYGAGTGLLTLTLQPRVASLVALDSSAGMLDQLTKKVQTAGILNVETRLWNIEDRPYPETGFDLVVSSMTLHHLKNVPLVLERLAKALKPGGWMAVADLDSEDGSFHGRADDVYHHGFQRPEIATWLETAGLGNVEMINAHVIRKPASTGELRKYGVFLAVGQRTG